VNHAIVFINSTLSKRQRKLVILFKFEKAKLNLTALASPDKYMSISSEKCMISQSKGMFFL